MSDNDELFFYGEPQEIQYYVDQATKIDYSTYDQQSPRSVAASLAPRRIRHPRKDEIQDLALADAIQQALGNAEVIRDNAQFLSSSNRLLVAPDAVSSIYDIAIQESNILFGQGGVAAALSDFDAVFSTQMNWGKTEFPSESGTIGFAEFDSQQEETARFNAAITKAMADGSLFSVEHNMNYSEVNQRTDLGSSRPFNSQFSGNPGVGMSYRLPMMQGAGAEYTRIAGTIVRRPTLQGIPTVNQGVVIARIRTDIALADFEAAVNNLVKDVEDSYWDLYLAYRRYDAEMVSAESALRTWRQVRVNQQANRVGIADEAQARDNYYEVRARSEDSLAVLYNAELRLRRLMGLPVNDGNVIRPATEPMTAEVSLDWHTTLAEALVHRPELRRQKWNIKSLELQHTAACKLVRPRLDFVASYAVNAFGDQLTGDGPNFHSAYATLLSGKHTNWGLGFEFSMPFGFRGAVTQVENYEHRLAKSRAILAQQELEISHELANAFQQIDQAYQTAKTNFNRRRAAERRVDAAKNEYESERTTLDLVLRAQISLAAAEVAYYSSLVGYNRALNDLKFRKGTILTENSVFLTEGVWHEEAYDDALRRAWERSFAFDVSDWMDATEPEEFVFGCPTCHPTQASPEPLPAEEELPYEPDAPPLERSEPEPIPPGVTPPRSDRSARLDGEAETGGLGGGPVAPYDVPAAAPPIPDPPASLIPASPNSVPLIPAGDGAAQIETLAPESQLQPVEFRQPADPTELPIPETRELPVPEAAPMLETIPSREIAPPAGLSPIEDDFAPPVPRDGGLSDEGLSIDPFVQPNAAAGFSPAIAPQPLPRNSISTQATSRSQLLQEAPQPLPDGAAARFPEPVDRTADDAGFPMPLKQLRRGDDSMVVPASRTESPGDSGVRQADGEKSRDARYAVPPPVETPRKRPRVSNWNRFLKWGK